MKSRLHEVNEALNWWHDVVFKVAIFKLLLEVLINSVKVKFEISSKTFIWSGCNGDTGHFEAGGITLRWPTSSYLTRRYEGCVINGSPGLMGYLAVVGNRNDILMSRCWSSPCHMTSGEWSKILWKRLMKWSYEKICSTCCDQKAIAQVSVLSI